MTGPQLYATKTIAKIKHWPCSSSHILGLPCGRRNANFSPCVKACLRISGKAGQHKEGRCILIKLLSHSSGVLQAAFLW